MHCCSSSVWNVIASYAACAYRKGNW